MRGHVLPLLGLLGVALSTSVTTTIAATTTPALRAPSRVVPVFEATAKPGTTGTYTLCQLVDNSAFSAEINDASNECAIKTSFSWTDGTMPTAPQRRELCSCTLLIQQLQTVTVPRCSLVRGGQIISYAQFIAYGFGLCNLDGSTTSSTTTTTTVSPSRTFAPTTYSPNTISTDGSSDGEKKSSNTAMIAGIIGGVVVCVILAVFIAYKCGKKRKATRKSNAEQAVTGHAVIEAMPLSPVDGLATNSSYTYTAVAITPKSDKPRSSAANRTSTQQTHKTSTSTGSSGGRVRVSEMAMWDDPMIIAVRIPHDMIFFGPLIASGGYGEVYKGTYKGETVAIKQLLPARRKDLVQIDAFLGEIKLMSQLDHERIVRFIGVAWNSLSDACAVVEYMENGDLRSVLTRWDGDDERRPQGFDADKIKIALHIAHALTYLHSLQPVVVHRDLKSKNILLNKEYDAKLTDFGVSRERADSTMTAGVGSSLWMAPEVMMGERYDEKADVFSFGVVLSELDSHKLPYAHIKDTGSDHKVPDSAILQMVSLGRLSILFSDSADPHLVKLGRDCVELDAKKRPTAAEVLHRVHQASRRSF